MSRRTQQDLDGLIDEARIWEESGAVWEDKIRPHLERLDREARECREANRRLEANLLHYKKKLAALDDSGEGRTEEEES